MLPMILRVCGGGPGNPGERDKSQKDTDTASRNQSPRKHRLAGPVSYDLNSPKRPDYSHQSQQQPRTYEFEPPIATDDRWFTSLHYAHDSHPRGVCLCRSRTGEDARAYIAASA